MKVIHGGNQMSLIRDTEEVVKFLEFAGRKSILKVFSRKPKKADGYETTLSKFSPSCGKIVSIRDVPIA